MRVFCSAILAMASVSPALAQIPANWKQIGAAGEWSHTVAMTGMNGHLWSIEADGTLYVTDLSGSYAQVGPKGFFAHVTMLEGLDGKLYTIEQGTLYATDPAKGVWSQLGQKGEWANTVAL